MTDVNRVIDGYLAVWNETDAGRRRKLIANVYTNDATYIDPIMSGAGHDGIDRMVAGAQAQFPGHVFRRTGKSDNHNDCLRFMWELVGPDGKDSGVAGTDFATVSDDGRIAAITGFLDRMPAAAQ